MIYYVGKCLNCDFHTSHIFNELLTQTVSEQHMMQSGHTVIIDEVQPEENFHHF